MGGGLAPWGCNLAALSNAVAAEGDDYKALVCLFFDGGNDQDNTFVPFDSVSHARYLAIRGGGPNPIAIGRSALETSVLNPRQPLAGGRQYALHPQWRGIANLFNQGTAAVLLNVGPLIVPLTRAQYQSGDRRFALPPKLFSHSDQMSTFQTSQPEGATAGYGGAMADLFYAQNTTPLLTSISVASAKYTFLAGEQVAPYQMTVQGALPISPIVDERGPAAATLARLIQHRRPHVLEDAYSQIVRFSIATQSIVASALGDYRPRPGASFLGNQLEMVVRVAAARTALGARRQVFYVWHGGYDTHAAQTGTHARKLGEVSEAIADFQAAALAAGVADKLTLFTASDFGRTLTSNGDGTDHGWGNHHVIVGGAVKGGAFYGNAPPVRALLPLYANFAPDRDLFLKISA